MNIKQISKPRLYLALVLLLILLILAVSFAIRGFILRKAIDSVNARVRRHQYSAHWDGARFKGLNTVFVKGIYIQSRKGGMQSLRNWAVPVRYGCFRFTIITEGRDLYEKSIVLTAVSASLGCQHHTSRRSGINGCPCTDRSAGKTAAAGRTI